MKKRVLITGANGFDKDHLTAAAPARDSGILAAVRTGNSIQYPEETDITYTFPDFGEVTAGDTKNPVMAVVPVSAKPGEFVFVNSLIVTRPLTETGFSGVTKGQYNVSERHIYDHYAGSEWLNKTLHEKTLKFHFPVSVVLVIGINKMNGFKQPKIKYKI